MPATAKIEGPLAKLSKFVVTRALMEELGDSLIKILASESKVYFLKRGWTGKDPAQGPAIWKSFKYKVHGDRLDVTSTFYGMAELAAGNIPRRRMTWLTQKAKDQHPGDYPLTDRERKLGMKQTGRVSKGQRLPLIVPIQVRGGAVEFRTAPLNLGNAWIHPGIARFTFFEIALRKWQKSCAQILAAAAAKAMTKAA